MNAKIGVKVRLKIWTARCVHRDRQNLFTAKAWLHGCVFTQLEKDRKIANRYCVHGFTSHVMFSLCLEILRLDSSVTTVQKYYGFMWTKCPVKFFNQLKIRPVPCERNLKGEANITSWPLLHLIVIFLRNLPKKLFYLFHWKWLGYKKMWNTIEQFWYIQIHTWGTTMNNTFLLFYSPKVWLLIYWNWSLFASFTVNLPNVEMQAS